MYPRGHFAPVALLLCCDNIKDWSIRLIDADDLFDHILFQKTILFLSTSIDKPSTSGLVMEFKARSLKSLVSSVLKIAT